MKKRCITFDSRLITHPGIGRYIRSLLNAMLTRAENLNFVLLGRREHLESFMAYPHVKIRPCEIRPYSLKEALTLQRYYEPESLVHVPHFNVPWSLPERLVVTIHDLTYLYVPEYEPFRGARWLLAQNFKRIARRAQAVIAVSEATHRDCEKNFPAMQPKLTTILEAADPTFATPNGCATHDVVEKYALQQPFILCVGAIREHKNVQALIKAVCQLEDKRGMRVPLVLVGALDERFARKHEFIASLVKRPQIRYLGKVSDADLKGLYRAARCLVMPSYYEGFGLPVLEAMACGTPVIVSNRTSLPELVADAGLTFDPDQIDALSLFIYNIVSDPVLHQKYSSQGFARSQSFTWERAASQTLEVYNKVLG